MNHFIVRERQNEILVVMIKHREGEVVLMILPINRVAPEVIERVVHPAHVPLEGETKPAKIRRARDQRPGGGFLRHRDHAGTLGVHQMIELAKKFDRFQVFAPAVLIWNPLSFLAGIVEVKHRRHRVHAQTIDVIAVAPEEGVGGQEIVNLVPAVVENEGPPILVRALARVFMLVERRAVETCQRPLVAREMRRDPIHQQTDAGLVHRIDEILKIVRSAEATGGRIKSGHLVAPRRIKRVFRDRKEFHVGEAHLLHVVNQRAGNLAVTERFGQRFLPPGTEMHFVNAHR